MNIDHELQNAVLTALDLDPAIDRSHLGVVVRDRIVTLWGHVASNGEKRAAEIVAGRVGGIKAVIDDVLVELPGRWQTADEALAERCYEQLAGDRAVPGDRIHLTVAAGRVILHGDVDRDFQRAAAEANIAMVPGVITVVNDLVVKPAVETRMVRDRIRQMLSPISIVDAERIEVETEGTHVTLRGRVNSWHERGLAESAVWMVPGVTGLDDQIVVDA